MQGNKRAHWFYWYFVISYHKRTQIEILTKVEMSGIKSAW